MTNLKRGDRVVVPSTIACGGCFFCKKQFYSLCDNSNTNPEIAETAYGYSGSGLFGYSHMLGGYAGGQAEYARVPFADVGPMKVPAHLSDEQVLFLSDISDRLHGGRELQHRAGGYGGGVGVRAGRALFIKRRSSWGGRVIAIDDVQGRLDKARDDCGAQVVTSPR